MTITLSKKLAAALSLGILSLGTVAATPAMARHNEYRAGDYYRGGYEGRTHYRDYYRGDRHYRNSGYHRGHDYRYDRYRCRDNGTGGAIIGAIAGGLLGSEVSRRGEKTTGAVVGAAVGAVAGHVIDKGDGRRC